MSISWGAQYPKLKTNLRLAINRMKMMGKKKTELGMKARTEIADYIQAHKADRARIRVEHIIREDYLVEAYELLEMYCDLLLARFGLIEQMKTLDDGIAEAVISILWAAPRITTDIPEMKVISDQLTHKYGKPFAEAARGNQLEAPAKVAAKLIAKLEIAAPPKPLVERYMIEIANAAGIPFTPDPNVMREDEVNQAEQMLIKFHEQGGGGVGGISQPAPTVNQLQDSGYGWNLPYGGGHPPPGGAPPPPPYGGGGGGGNIYEVPSATPKYDVPPGDDFNWQPMPPNQPQAHGPGVIQLPQIGPNGLPINPSGGPQHAPPPAAYPFLSQRGSMANPPHPIGGPSAPPQTVRKDGTPPGAFDLDLNFPEVPTGGLAGNNKPNNGPGGGGGAGGNDLDFDELARRFDQLKKK